MTDETPVACPICAALTLDPVKNAAWHGGLEKAAAQSVAERLNALRA